MQGMDNKKETRSGDHKKSDPQKVYNEELKDKGSEWNDTEREGDARDMAKIQKAMGNQGQKMDTIHPDDLAW